MKRSIAQHEQILKNLSATLARYEQELSKLHDRVERTRTDCKRLEYQLHEAKRRGQTHFDPEKFLFSRKGEFKFVPSEDGAP